MQQVNLSNILRLFVKHTPYMLIILISSYFFTPYVYNFDKVYELNTAIVFAKLDYESNIDKLLNKATVDELLSSKDFKNSLSLSGGKSNKISSFKVSSSGNQNTKLTKVRFYGDNIDDIVSTSSLVINELRKIDKNTINVTLQRLKREIELNKSIINELEKNAKNQYYNDVIDVGNVNIVLLEADDKQLAADLGARNIKLDRKINSYKEISYISPINRSSVTLFFPGKFAYLGLSILFTLLYFFIVINYYYLKLRK